MIVCRKNGVIVLGMGMASLCWDLDHVRLMVQLPTVHHKAISSNRENYLRTIKFLTQEKRNNFLKEISGCLPTEVIELLY